MPTLYAVTAIHVTGSSAQQPTAERVLAAFRTVFVPEKGFRLLGDAVRITRQIHAEQRQPTAIERGIGLLTIGAGVLTAPLTMGASLVGVIGSEAATRAARGLATSLVTTTATAVVETDLPTQAARDKIATEMQHVLGAGWGRVVIASFDSNVNGAEADWRSGAVQRGSRTTQPQSLVALIATPRENPTGPTPAGVNIPGSGVITSIVGDATAAGRAAVDNATAALRAGVANVTGAAGDGIRNLSAAAAAGLGNVTGGVTGAARSVLGTLALALGGAGAVFLGASYLIGKSSGRSAAEVAGSGLSSGLGAAFALTPAGRAKRLVDAAASNPWRSV
jgi:hypothetical protein